MKSGVLRFSAGLLSAFVAAVCTETLLTCGYTGIWLLFSQPIHNTDVGDGFSFIAISAMYASAIIALPTTAFVALPYFIISNHLGHSSRRYYLRSGLIIGLLVILAVGIWHFRYPGPPFRIDFDVVFFTVSSMIAGAMATLAFWGIARPDRLQQGQPASG